LDFAFNEEQEAFREALRSFMEQVSPPGEVFRLMETREGYDAAVWKRMSEELGLPGLHVPEDFGGQGFGPLELALVFEEMGRVLLCAPYFSSACLATGAVLNAGTGEQKTRWLPGLASGERIGTLALLDGDSWSPGAVALEFARDGDDFVLDGTKQLVTDGAVADLLVVAARRPGSTGEDGLTLLVVEGDARGLARTSLEPLDPTRKLARIELDGVRGHLLGDEGTAAPALARTLDQASAALAAEAVGGAERCLELAVAYAKQRVQFARPIGSFQAIKHKCAEVLLEVESARGAAYYAGWAAAEDGEALPLAAAVARSYCAEAYLRAAEENLHIHGGIGFTWEATPHLYLKRARGSAILLGDPVQQRSRIAAAKGF
jgi:alkylation response protein AidB-like acyl-CoA dehydrogenase